MAYDPSFSVNITSNPIDVQVADMNGDNYPILSAFTDSWTRR